MKINKSKKISTKKKLAIIAAAVVLAAGTALVLVFALHINPLAPNDSSSQKNSTDKESLQQQSDAYRSTKEQAASPQSETPPTEPGNNKTSVAVIITSPPTQSIDSFRVRAYVQRPTSQGTCRLTLSSNGKDDIVKQTSGMQPNNQISGCQDILIPASELSVGTWSATLSYDSDSYTGTVTQTIKVE